MLSEVALGVVRQVSGEFFAVPDGVEQEGTAVAEAAEHIVHVEVSLHVACHEVRRLDLVRGADGRVAEAEVRAGEAARLLRVVGEVSLAILVRVVADNLHRVLVRTDRTVSTQAVELGLEDAFATECLFSLEGQRGEGHVVHDAHREVVLRFGQGEVVVDGDNHRRRSVGRAEAVAAAHDDGAFSLVVEGILHVEVERFAAGAGFLSAVEHGNLLARLGYGSEQVLHGEGAIEVNAHHADLLALRVEVVDGLAGSFRHGAHADDYAVSVVSAVVAEELVFAAGDLGDFGHVLLHDGGHSVVVAVADLAVSEERFGVFGHTAGHGMFGSECAAAELAHLVHRHEGADSLLVHHLNLLVLVRGAEAVEEVDEGHAAFERSQVSYGREVHHLLYGAFAEHGEARLAAGHHVLVVTEDTERVAGQRTCRHVEHAREQFARNLVHIRNHQQQALRCCKRRGERTGLERTVHSAGGAAFALHFLHLHRVAKEVDTALCRPFVHVFSHGRARRNRVNGSNFREHVRYVRSGLVAVTSNEFLVCHSEL